MSFGWSAGDIAQALVIVTKVVKALNDVDGAPAHYREAVSFLSNLKMTLEALKFESVGLDPKYVDEIKKQVQKIRLPIEGFLTVTRGYEASLGTAAKQGRLRNVKKKLDWRFVVSKKADALRRTIEGDMMVLNSIQTRLILESSISMPAIFDGLILNSITDELLPRLKTTLQEQVHPLHVKVEEESEAQLAGNTLVMSMLGTQSSSLQGIHFQINKSRQESDGILAANFSELNQNLEAAKECILRQILAKVDALESKHLQSGSVAAKVDSKNSNRTPDIEQTVQRHGRLARASIGEESLRQLYYAVLLCLGCLLRDIFLALSRMIRPKGPLTARLLAEYNISFYDALGRSPRILAYENFVSYKIFEAFLGDAFTDRPGASWVERGLFMLANARNGKTITSQSWERMISPGSHVNMSMLVKKVHDPDKPNDNTCPDTDCKGTLAELADKGSKECSACGKHVSLFQNANRYPSQETTDSEMRPGFPSQDRGSRERALETQADHLKPSTRSDENIELRQTSTAGKTIGGQGQAKLPQAKPEEIGHFKRVVLALEQPTLPTFFSKSNQNGLDNESQRINRIRLGKGSGRVTRTSYSGYHDGGWVDRGP